MKLPGIALVLLSAVTSQGACAPTPARGAIAISYTMWGRETDWRIDAAGRLGVHRTDEHPMPGDAARSDEEYDVGSAGYAKIARLVAPMRQWVGGAMPCARTINETLKMPGSTQNDLRATLHWEGSGETVRLELNCVAGPSQDALARVKQALDLMKGWASAAPLPTSLGHGDPARTRGNDSAASQD